jgi:hypothetical protein
MKLDIWIEGWGHGEGICQVWGMKNKCERHNTERSDGQEKDNRQGSQEKKKKKKEQKDPLVQKKNFFRSDGGTLTRTSEPSRIDPVVDLWTTDRARFGDESGHGPLYMNLNPSGSFCHPGTNHVFWVLQRVLRVLRGNTVPG